MSQPPGRLAVAAAYFLIYVVWGSTYYFIGVCLHDFPPFMLGTVRFAVAGLALLAVCRLRGERLLRRVLIFKSAVCGIILLFVDQGVIMFAQRYVSSSLVAIMASCLPCAQDCRAISAVCSYPQYQPFHGFRWPIL